MISTNQKNNHKHKKGLSSSMKIYIICCVVFIVVLSGTIIYFAFFQGKAKGSGSSASGSPSGGGQLWGTKETDSESPSDDKVRVEDVAIDDLTYDPTGPGNTDLNFSDNSVEYIENADLGFVNDVIIVCFEDGTTIEDKKNILKKYGLSVAGQSDSRNEVILRIEKKDLASIEQLSKAIQEEKGVVIALPDYVLNVDEHAYTPTDPWDDSGLKGGMAEWNENSPDGDNWYMEAIDARGAWEYWDRITPVTVGVIDNGMYAQHRDLSGKVTCFTEPEIKTETDNTKCHATHVTGLIAAKENDMGMCGVSNRSDVLYVGARSLLEDRVCSSEKIYGTVLSDLQNKVDVLVKNGAKVINYSRGLVAPESDDPKEIEKKYSRDSLDSTAEYLSKGMESLLRDGYDFIIVQSAGNGTDDDKGFDAYYNGFWASITEENCYSDVRRKEDILDRIIIVGATESKLINKNGSKAYQMTEWSNAGTNVDICAPGENILSTVTGEKPYERYDGTSMSAPIVSGVCALVWGADSKLTGAEVKKIVCKESNSSYKVFDNSGSPFATGDYCMVNARLAVEDALNITHEPPVAEVSPGGMPEHPEWAKVYLQKLESLDEINEMGWQYIDYVNFSLIYLDGDDIPEMIAHIGKNRSSALIYTYYNGEYKVLDGILPWFSYIPRTGLIYVEADYKGYAQDNAVYQLKDGEIVALGQGIYWYAPYDEDPNTFVPHWEWDGVEVSEKEYNENIDRLYNNFEGSTSYQDYKYNEMIEMLKSY